MKKFLLFVIMTVLAITSVACGKKDTSKASASKGDRFVTNLGSDPYTLDSAISTDNNSNYVIEHLFATLYRQTTDGKFEKDLVERGSWGRWKRVYILFEKRIEMV